VPVDTIATMMLPSVALPVVSALLLQVAREDVTRMLRADALKLGLGLLLIVVGLAAAAAHARMGRGAVSALPWFGLFSFLYGLRLLARTDTFPLFFSAPPVAWRYVAAAITYVILVPGLLLLRAVFPAWRRHFGGAAAFVAAFAVVAVLSDAVRRRPASAEVPNNLIAITFILVGIVVVFRPQAASRDLRTLRIGLGSFAATAIVDNLRGLHVLSWPRSDVEPLGSTVFIACLGTIAVRRVFKDAERLLALDKELSVARRIQASILPHAMPQVAGLSVAARYEPMTAVAGDFYDFLEVGEKGLGVLVADVSGHGVPAALIASMVKVAIAGQRSQADRPAAVLAGMNETLAGRLGGQYVTAAYLFLDREAGRMRYSAAGHPPLLRWRRDEARAHEIEENGLPLGMMEVAEYRELEQPLGAGDRFLLYTDGLVDATNALGEFFTIDRVKDALAASGDLTTEGVADRILEKTRGWADKVAADDLTVVLVDCV
jgi:sigma-B regulation protein RsbU (phosphoserine phosphatase)